jgi:alanine-glyoxylate transaminase/(R)-3-amino-2-methylpropionate-pyruvate transaminase
MASTEYRGPSLERTRQIRRDNLNPAMATYYKNPLLIHKGEMQWLWDHEGRKYLDMFAGIVTVSVGHCHPKVTAALEEQIKTLWHTTNIYLHPKVHEYAERLVATLPDPLNVVYFVNSGSEANDLAMFMSRLYTGNNDILSFRNAYHGMSPYTMGLTAQNTWKYRVPAGQGIHHVMLPDTYRGLWGDAGHRDCPVRPQGVELPSEADSRQVEDRYLDQLEEVIRFSLPKGKSIAAFFAESIQGVGGCTQYPRGYLARAFERVREQGGLCVSDEVQTGFCRTGEHYWGFQGHGVVPDIVTMAKGIGNGFPMAAVVTTPEVAAVMAQCLHFNTFGGNPMASAVGLAVLDALEEDGCQAVSREVGTHLLERLVKLVDSCGIVGDVRGKGLMIGMEMVEDKETKTPLAHEKMMDLWELTKDAGVLLGKGGYHGNVFRIKPPMCITKEDADFTVDAFEKAVRQIEAGM